MEDSLKSDTSKGETVERESKIFVSSKITGIHPLAFTIEFDDQKFDESRTSKVRERLNAFTLKHRRNPSLPDFRGVNDLKGSSPVEKAVSPDNARLGPDLRKRFEKSGKISETHWKSTALKTAKNLELKTPFLLRENLVKSLKIGRRYSLDGIDDSDTSCQNVNLGDSDGKIVEFECGSATRNDDLENKSDTVSEAGTYTVDKEKEEAENDTGKTHIWKTDESKENLEYLNGTKKNDHRNWITDWVRDVEEQNLLNPALKEPPPLSPCPSAEKANGFCTTSRIPSPLNTLGRKAKPRSSKSGDGNKLNGYTFHRRSSSLSAKDYTENHGSESSLETESFLRTTESVMTSMQSRMKFSIDRRSPDFRRADKKNSTYKERPHPPSTASDTDTNSETDAKTFKKPIGNPFTSARLNRAFSLRRAKADPEKDSTKTQTLMSNTDPSLSVKLGQTPKATASKPPSYAPFSRLDCGRFSMRSTMSSARVSVVHKTAGSPKDKITKSSLANQTQKKEVKKTNGSNRSTSSLSSREVEFQNWRRRKSFDPMKAAAEGRKKELAKKAAMNHSLAQSVNLGSGPRIRHSLSSAGNPVLRSASFHSTAQVLGDEENDKFQDQGSAGDQESASSFQLPSRHSRPLNSPSELCIQCVPSLKNSGLSSRSSLVSETHSSPSRCLRSNGLENLVLSAISEASHTLKLKSCKLLKKLSYMYEPSEEKSFRLRDEIAVLESSQNSLKNSPVHQGTSGDLSVILKNLKGVENVFNLLEDVLFDENLEVYVKE